MTTKAHFATANNRAIAPDLPLMTSLRIKPLPHMAADDLATTPEKDDPSVTLSSTSDPISNPPFSTVVVPPKKFLMPGYFPAERFL